MRAWNWSDDGSSSDSPTEESIPVDSSVAADASSGYSAAGEVLFWEKNNEDLSYRAGFINISSLLGNALVFNWASIADVARFHWLIGDRSARGNSQLMVIQPVQPV